MINIQPGAFIYRIYASQGPSTTLQTATKPVRTTLRRLDSHNGPGQIVTIGFGTDASEDLEIESVGWRHLYDNDQRAERSRGQRSGRCEDGTRLGIAGNKD